MISNTETLWVEPLLARMPAQKPEVAALTKVLELKKDDTQVAGVPLLPLMSMGLWIGGEAFWWQKERLSKIKRKSSPY